MTTKQTLQKTLALLKKRGWCQHVSNDTRTGSYCVIGALSEVSMQNDGALYTHPKDVIMRAMRIHTYKQDHIIAWNDTRGRTKAQVYKVLRTAIKLA